jgi:shikimate kinase
MRIFLIGYMGVGKTTIGKRLANALDMDFLDLDHFIESSTGRSIPDIFKKEGEVAFRGLEKKYLTDICMDADNVVVATGGGTPCFYNHMEIMNKHGITVYLQMDVRSIVYRLVHAKETRPLVEDKAPENLDEYVKQHLEERREFYEEAHITAHALGFNQKKMEELVAEISAYSSK